MAKEPAGQDKDPTQDALFREVDDDLRQDKMAQAWSRYGNWAIAAAVALVLAVGANQYWKKHQADVRLEEASRFSAALDKVDAGDAAGASAAFAALADEGSTGYAPLSALRHAALLKFQGDKEGAIAAYDAIAADGTTEQMFRDLATVLSAMHRVESGDPEVLKQKLTPLTDAKNPWRFSASELLALLALRQGDKEEARRLYGTLASSTDAPQGIQDRAKEVLMSLGGEIVPQQPDTPPPAGDPAPAQQ